MSEKVRLTQTVQKGGCAAKVPAVELRKILSQLHFPPTDKDLLVDGGLFDDAAIYRVNDSLALVQTLDFFTPIVDTPFLFGRIAAANALSDVYAMGGEPKTAMAILAFPLATLPSEIAVQTLQGACEAMRDAGCNFVGGHSIDDDTLKFGLSVTGYVNPAQAWSNNRARSGDQLILTKALGTGTLTAGLKRGAWAEAEMTEALDSMGQVNRVGDLLSDAEWSAIRSATDITGFGLAGHAMQMARASRKTFVFDFANLPVFPKVWMSLKEGFLTKAHKSNRDYTEATCDFSAAPLDQLPILFDPQTSGGLLLSVDPAFAENVERKLQRRFGATTLIGEVLDQEAKELRLR